MINLCQFFIKLAAIAVFLLPAFCKAQVNPYFKFSGGVYSFSIVKSETWNTNFGEEGGGLCYSPQIGLILGEKVGVGVFSEMSSFREEDLSTGYVKKVKLSYIGPVISSRYNINKYHVISGEVTYGLQVAKLDIQEDRLYVGKGSNWNFRLAVNYDYMIFENFSIGAVIFYVVDNFAIYELESEPRYFLDFVPDKNIGIEFDRIGLQLSVSFLM